jgi:hypothetical protein
LIRLQQGNFIRLETNNTIVAYQIRFGDASTEIVQSRVTDDVPRTIHTVTKTSEVISGITIWNTSESTSTTIQLFFNGDTVLERPYIVNLEPSGFTIIEDDVKVYDSAGLLLTGGCTNITVSAIAPTNPSLGDLWVSI